MGKKDEKKPKVETPEEKVAEISKEITKVSNEAKKLVTITTQDQYEKAGVWLSTVVKPRINRIKEVAASFTDPWKESRKTALAEMNRIEAMFATSLKPLEAIEASVKSGMGTFLRIQDEAARKEEKRLEDLRNKQNEKREAAGKDAIATPLPTVARPQQTVSSVGGGRSTAKQVWKFEIKDRRSFSETVQAAILEEAYTTGLTEKVIRKMVAAGMHDINGVRIYQDYDVSVTAQKD